jgi:hypothetical protein
MRISSFSLAILLASPVPAIADVQGYVLNASENAQWFAVLDNGSTICNLAPGDHCQWPMTFGSHRVEINRQDGYGLSKDFNVTSEFGTYPHETFWDCDFTDDCEDEDW